MIQWIFIIISTIIALHRLYVNIFVSITDLLLDCAQSSSEFEDLFESRVSLLLRCCKGKLQHLRPVIEKIQSSNWLAMFTVYC